jgi:hypothetical protein
MDLAQLVAAASMECAFCGKKSMELCQCPCQTAYYCGNTCQTGHWAVHKSHCSYRDKGNKLSSCINCGLASQRLKSCPCQAVLYCSLQCQKEHWGVHRRLCSHWVSTFRRPKVRFTSVEIQTDVTCEDRLRAEQEARRRSTLVVTDSQGAVLHFTQSFVRELEPGEPSLSYDSPSNASDAVHGQKAAETSADKNAAD